MGRESHDARSKTKFMSHDQFQFKPGSDYDSSLLKKLDVRRTFENRSPPRRTGFSSSMNDATTRHGLGQRQQYPPLSLPIRSTSRMFGDGPLTEPPSQLAIPSRSALTSGFASGDYRSPIDVSDLDRSPPQRARRTNSGSVADDSTVSTQGSYENTDDTDFQMEDAGMGRLHIEENPMRADYHTIGQKRRASSPLGDDFPQGLPGAGELLRRREGASRASPTPRLTIPQSSLSSISSLGRSNSAYMSSLPLTATSTTSMTGSFGRRSPGALSPGGLSPVDGLCNSPFNTPISLTQSPHSTISRIPHQRQLSESRPLSSPRKLTELPKSSIPRIQGFFMCDCCPKKPKKFETAEELR
jgi:hypothetical protein